MSRFTRINTFYLFDVIIYKFSSSQEITESIIDKINRASEFKPIIIISRRKHLQKFDLTTKNIYFYPSNISIRLLSYEIKRIISTELEIQESTLSVCDLHLNLQTREVYRFNEKQYLRNKEFHLLEYLMRNTDILLSRQKILENVWDRNSYKYTNTVDVHMNTLRKKIDTNPDKRLIETIYCMGYIMHSTPFSLN